MKHTLAINYIGIAEAIVDVVKEAHNANRRVISIGLPPRELKELDDYLMSNMNTFDNKKRKILKGQINEAFGIPIVASDKLQITTEFSRFKPLHL